MMQNKQRGFTLVELLLAMTFLSLLLIAIAGLMIQIVNIYTKGVTLTAVSTAGEMISSEMQRTLNQSSPSKVVYTSNNNGGRLCTGSSTYVWNYGSAITGTGPSFVDANKYTDNTTNIRFIKLEDPDGVYCKPDLGNGALPVINKAQATELLQGQDRNLVLHGVSFYAQTIATSGQTVYSIGLEVGTNNSDESSVIKGQRQCNPPTDANDDFCAINRFAFTARAGNQDQGVRND